jgi:O-antigen/teichoic acid export membrane protein
LLDLVASTGIYALASAASPLISFVLAPFLTHSLSRGEFGALAVLNTIIALAVVITQIGLGSAFFRAYNYDYETPRDRLHVFATVVELLLLTSVPVAIVAIVAAPRLAELLLGAPSFEGAVRVAAVVVLVQNLTVPGYAWLRAESRAVLFTVLTVASLLCTMGATIVLVGVAHTGISGALLAIGIGYGVVVFCTLPLVLLRSGFPLRWDIASNLLSFGVPLVVASSAFWVLQLSDRYLLSRLASLAQTANYTVAYSLGSILSVVVLVPFMLAWPTAFFAIAKREDAQRTFQLIFRWYCLSLLLLTFAFSPAATLLLLVLFPPAYHSAAAVIPIVAVSVMFYGIYVVFSVGVGIRRKNWYSSGLMMTSALANVGINLILIPMYGSMGAAVATLLAFALLALGAYLVNQRIYPVPFEVGLFGVALAIGILLYAVASLVAATGNLFGGCAAYLAALSVYVAILLVLGKSAGGVLRGKRQLRREDAVS